MLFDRGSFLRKLRELEKEDELERQREMETVDEETEVITTDTLDYQRYIKQQQMKPIYDDYKHVNYRCIDFGHINNSTTPLIIEQDRSVGKGGLVWDAGYILGDSLIQKQDEWLLQYPQRIVELGSLVQALLD